MSEAKPAREFARRIVQQLREAGYQALFAGGCVRDQLLGIEPQDYDVATDARPAQVREIFGRRRTLAIGAAFGVITVLGAKKEGQIEVATFRCDAGYSDGRHPDRVTYSSAEEDAKRRDFTINGLFYDPLREQLIDHVGGQEDLQRRLVRAIGDPHARIAEDKLRMLRAVRFAATLDFELEPDTLAAICDHRAEIHVVSVERIASEMRRILVDRHRRRAVELLQGSGLLQQILPEVAAVASDPSRQQAWETTLEILQRLAPATFPSGMAALLSSVAALESPVANAESVGRRWKLSNDDRKRTAWLLEHESDIRTADTSAWSVVQPLLIDDGVMELLAVAEATAQANSGSTTGIEFCRQQLALPTDRLNPALLVNGEDLIRDGKRPGPRFAQVLQAVRNAQLDGTVSSREEALELARQLWAQPSHPS